MSSLRPGVLVFIGSSPLREAIAHTLEGCVIEFVESPVAAREILAAMRFDLVIITNLEVSPWAAVELIPEDHTYPVLFLSGFMDPPLPEICKARRIYWRPVPVSWRALRREVWEIIGSHAVGPWTPHVVPPGVWSPSPLTTGEKLLYVFEELRRYRDLRHSGAESLEELISHVTVEPRGPRACKVAFSLGSDRFVIGQDPEEGIALYLATSPPRLLCRVTDDEEQVELGPWRDGLERLYEGVVAMVRARRRRDPYSFEELDWLSSEGGES